MIRLFLALSLSVGCVYVNPELLVDPPPDIDKAYKIILDSYNQGTGRPAMIYFYGEKSIGCYDTFQGKYFHGGWVQVKDGACQDGVTDNINYTTIVLYQRVPDANGVMVPQKIHTTAIAHELGHSTFGIGPDHPDWLFGPGKIVDTANSKVEAAGL
jgi:hypothetical protein